MLKKFFNFALLFLTSGVLFHRCTLIGLLCAVWVYFGAEVEESAFQRMLTPDLYLFMSSFLIFYRFLFKKVFKADNDLDWTSMFVYFLGDMAWAIAAMFCAIPFFMMLFHYSGTDYTQQARTAIDPRHLMRRLPKP